MEVVVDQLRIVSIDEEGKIYDKVSRVRLESERTRLLLDYHSFLLPLRPTDVLSVVIYKGEIGDNDVPREFEYVMLGKCYKYTEEGASSVYDVSFGGLLLKIESSDALGICDFDDVAFACKRI